MKSNIVLDKFKKVRHFKNFSLKELAKVVDITPSYLSMIENGKRSLNYSLAIKLADCLSTTPDDLFLEDFKLLNK